MSSALPPIDPLKVAAKMDAARNFEFPAVTKELAAQPRLFEACWFIQWASAPANTPGGLQKFCEEFVEFSRADVGPESLLKFAGKSKLSPSEVSAALEDFPVELASKIMDAPAKAISALVLGSSDKLSEAEVNEIQGLQKSHAASHPFEVLHAAAVNFAAEDLGRWFTEFFEDPAMTFNQVPDRSFLDGLYGQRVWYFPRVWSCLLRFMDAKAKAAREAIAQTSITREMWQWLDHAMESGASVMFMGNSRFGKSWAARAFAATHPGRARVVECPSGGSLSDLLREIARALNLPDRLLRASLDERREAIDRVVRSAGFLLIFDEAQMLYPQRGGRHTSPPRLDYVRRQIIDAGVPAAFICTHQSWNHVEKSYLRLSSYSHEQMEGRLARIIELPGELGEEDMMAVAAVHLPDLEPAYHHFLVKTLRAIQGDHLSRIQQVADLARLQAKKRWTTVPELSDLKKAMQDLLGCFQKTSPQPEPLSSEPTIPPLKRGPKPPLPGRAPTPRGACSAQAEPALPV